MHHSLVKENHWLGDCISACSSASVNLSWHFDVHAQANSTSQRPLQDFCLTTLSLAPRALPIYHFARLLSLNVVVRRTIFTTQVYLQVLSTSIAYAHSYLFPGGWQQVWDLLGCQPPQSTIKASLGIEAQSLGAHVIKQKAIKCNITSYIHVQSQNTWKYIYLAVSHVYMVI